MLLLLLLLQDHFEAPPVLLVDEICGATSTLFEHNPGYEERLGCLLEVGVSQGLSSGDTQLGLFLEHFSEKVAGGVADVLEVGAAEVEVAFTVLDEDIVEGPTWEETFAEEEMVEDSTNTEHVCDWSALG